MRVVNAHVGPAHHSVATITDAAGAFGLTLVEDDGGYAARRQLHILPFISDAFVAGGSGGYMKEVAHTSFTLQGPGSALAQLGYMSVYVSHDEESTLQIEDHTVVMLTMEVQIASEYFDATDSHMCPSLNVLMCAFSTQGDLLNCARTDAAGTATVSVPPGADITLRNGCTGAGVVVERCTTEEGLRPDLTIVDHATGAEAKVVTAQDAGSGAAHVFLDKTSRLLEVVYGAGSLRGLERSAATLAHIGAGSLGAIPDSNQLWPIAYAVSAATEFVAAHPTAGCGMTMAAAGAGAGIGDARFRFSIPRDLGFEITAAVDATHDGPVRAFMSLLPTRVVRACKPPQVDRWGKVLEEMSAWDNPELTKDEDIEIQNTCVLPTVEFLYRKKATIELVLVDSTDEPLAECAADTAQEGVFTVPQLITIDGEQQANKLAVSFEIKEAYNNSEAQPTARSGTTTLALLEGTLFTEDNIALGFADRSSWCTLANGCELTPVHTNGQSLFNYTISQINLPLRRAPHKRVLLAEFRPDGPSVAGGCEDRPVRVRSIAARYFPPSPCPLPLRNQAAHADTGRRTRARPHSSQKLDKLGHSQCDPSALLPAATGQRLTSPLARGPWRGLWTA